MKRYVKILFCAFIIILTFFAWDEINNKAEKVTFLAVDKIDFDTIKSKNHIIKLAEKENNTVVKTSTVKKSIQKNNSSRKTNTVKYGTFGRLYISGYSVALYDYNVNTTSSSSLQTLVNNNDSAAYYMNHDKLIIADHYYQGFSVITRLGTGATSYIKFKDGSIIRYRLIKKARGVNTGPDLKDTNGNSFFSMESDLIMYTCYEDGIIVTLWVLS